MTNKPRIACPPVAAHRSGFAENRQARPAAQPPGSARRRTLPEIAAASLLAAWLALPSPALADPPPWAPAHGYRAKQHHYVYYPRHQVYYAPSSQLWFWLDGGNWRVGTYLPNQIAVAGYPGVSIILDTERPYEMNTYVVERYGKRRKHRRHDHDD